MRKEKKGCPSWICCHGLKSSYSLAGRRALSGPIKTFNSLPLLHYSTNDYVTITEQDAVSSIWASVSCRLQSSFHRSLPALHDEKTIC